MTPEAESRVLVLYTGGTIGMLKHTGGGYAPHPGFLASSLRSQARFDDPADASVWTNSTSAASFTQWSASKSASGSTTPAAPPNAADESSALRVFTADGSVLLPSLVTPRFSQGKRVRYAIYEYERLIDSSEIEPSDFLRIAGDIERNYHHFDAFIVLHGTDSMAFSASALSFLLEDLGKPVILTGAQIPLSELFTDAIDNLLASLIIAGHYAIPEVCVFFGENLLRGNRSTKFSSSSFAAFESPNLPPLATVGIDVDVSWSRILRPGPRPFRAHKAFASDVTTLRIFPGITSAAVRALLSSGGIRGVVLESYGAGNAPRRRDLLQAFRDAADVGVVIVNVTQCVKGSVAPDIYETGRALAAAGVVGGGDMTTEAALAKLSYLLTKDLSPAQIRKLLPQPLRGELTPISPVPSFSSPPDAESRLYSLFSQIIELAPRQGALSPSHKTVPLPGDPVLVVPDEFSPSWPLTLNDEQALRSAINPWLLSQAASRDGPYLSSLISALEAPSLNANDAPCLPSVLNESATTALQTPLHLAVLSSLPANVDLLLSHGASVHARDAFGHSPLFYAAKVGGGGGAAMVKSIKAAGGHLSDGEIESGQVGLEVAKARKAGGEGLLLEAAGEEDLARAKAVLANML
ncbi:hypothetical protein JCM8547_003057 [Rhodosporidiobolus lusitaniae]